MPEDTELDNLSDDDMDADLADSDGDEGGSGDGGQVDVAALQREVADLRAQNAKLGNEFKSGVGRLHSMIAKLESGRGDTEALRRQIETQISGVSKTVEAILEDEGISPEIRARARSIAEKVKSESDLASVRAELEALKGGNGGSQREAPVNASEARTFERAMEFAIKRAGLDPDDPIFDWAGAATRTFVQQGWAAGEAYFAQKIDEASAAKQAAERRQTRKESAGKGTATPGGDSVRLLDPSKSREERLKLLREMGAI